MKRTIETIPLADTAFKPLVNSIDWHNSSMVSELRVAVDLDWLVQVDASSGDVHKLLGFSIVDVAAQEVVPPKNIAEVKKRLGHTTVGWFNNDDTAKGLGSNIANCPNGLQPHSTNSNYLAVRGLPFNSDTYTYRRPTHQQTKYHTLRKLMQHGCLLAASASIDAVSRSNIGTQTAMSIMEKRYGEARIVLMDAPPIWQMQHTVAWSTHDIPPKVMLARGGRFADSNLMTTVG